VNIRSLLSYFSFGSTADTGCKEEPLSEIAGLELDENTLDDLDKINEFNIRARYPDYKNEFYKKCDKKYANKYLVIIKKIYLNLCQGLKQKNSQKIRGSIER